MPQDRCDATAGDVGTAPAQQSCHDQVASRGAVIAWGQRQVLVQQPQRMHEVRIAQGIAAGGLEPFHCHRQRIQAWAHHQIAGGRRHQGGMHEQRVRPRLRIEQRQARTVGRIEHRAANPDGGGGRRCRNHELRQFRRGQLRPFEPWGSKGRRPAQRRLDLRCAGARSHSSAGRAAPPCAARVAPARQPFSMFSPLSMFSHAS